MTSTELKERSECRRKNIGLLRSITTDFEDIAHNLEQLANERDRCKKDVNELCQTIIKTLFLQINMKVKRIKDNITGIKPLNGGGIFDYSIKHKRPTMKSQLGTMSRIIRDTISIIEDNDLPYKERANVAFGMLQRFLQFWNKSIVPDLVSKRLLVRDDPLEENVRQEADELLKQIENEIREEQEFSSKMQSLHPPMSKSSK